MIVASVKRNIIHFQYGEITFNKNFELELIIIPVSENYLNIIKRFETPWLVL